MLVEALGTLFLNSFFDLLIDMSPNPKKTMHAAQIGSHAVLCNYNGDYPLFLFWPTYVLFSIESCDFIFEIYFHNVINQIGQFGRWILDRLGLNLFLVALFMWMKLRSRKASSKWCTTETCVYSAVSDFRGDPECVERVATSGRAWRFGTQYWDCWGASLFVSL